MKLKLSVVSDWLLHTAFLSAIGQINSKKIDILFFLFYFLIASIMLLTLIQLEVVLMILAQFN